jgi:hypothetical protein
MPPIMVFVLPATIAPPPCFTGPLERGHPVCASPTLAAGMFTISTLGNPDAIVLPWFVLSPILAANMVPISHFYPYGDVFTAKISRGRSTATDITATTLTATDFTH